MEGEAVDEIAYSSVLVTVLAEGLKEAINELHTNN